MKTSPPGPARRLPGPCAKHVVVVGAGIGGLATAAELAANGLRVTLLERAAQPGGKMRQVRVGGQPMDAGPTVFTMRWVFEELFEALGERLDTCLRLEPCEVLARHTWPDRTRLDLFADVRRSAEAMGDFAGAEAARGYLDFCRRAGEIHRSLEAPFLRATQPTPLSLVTRAGWRELPAMLRISPFATLWGELGRYFRDPRLRQLFGRYATYCGSSPFAAPATLMLVAHVEQSGVWRVVGGMHRVASCLAELATRRGALIRYGVHVDELLVDGGRACGVRLRDGERIAADAVVFNGDPAALSASALGGPARQAMPQRARGERSLSAITWNVLAEARGVELLRHNVFFSDDYPGEFVDLFQHRRVPSKPTVYVCAQDRADGAAGDVRRPQRLLVLINAPATGDQPAPNDEEIAACERACFSRLTSCGLRLRFAPDQMLRTTPADFHALFPATGGALYGQATHGWASSFARPSSHTRLPGLYLAGGSTHPGPGVPMAALSGRLASACVLNDLRSTSAARWRPAAMRGGTSMR